MANFPNRCQHLKINGTQCGSPALRRNRFCFFHKRHHQERIQLHTDRARRRLGESLQRFYPFFQSHHLEAFPVYGPPDACVRGLREVAEAGAELILLNPVFDEAEQMERLVAEVMPKLS